MITIELSTAGLILCLFIISAPSLIVAIALLLYSITDMVAKKEKAKEEKIDG